MSKTIYIEKEIVEHPSVEKIRQRYPGSQYIVCEHYSEVFNKKAQNFRLQKKSPSLILAQKQGQRVLPVPESFGITGAENYYFSHFLNCLYDCRYCFLQGMYDSANYVWFINTESFQADILDICEKKSEKSRYFFSGYDGDSLAFEPLTGFAETYIPFFAGLENTYLELRTKSTQIRSLLKLKPIEQCIVAFSFTPDAISQKVEHGVPSVESRIKAMKTLTEKGWTLGLRLDPLIDCNQFEAYYEELIKTIFAAVPAQAFHSVSVGPMRFPKKMYQKMSSLYPEDPLLSQPMQEEKGIYSYEREREEVMANFVKQQLLQYVDSSNLFKCYVS